MTWIAILCIGVALGWALEFLFDFLFWGRRNRRLEAQLDTCRSDYLASETMLSEARETVSQYQLKEDEYRQCQFDLTDLADKHNHLEVQADKISMELKTSQQLAGQLDQRSTELKEECDQLHDTLEEVDRWVESSMRQRVWNVASWKGGINRSKERTVAFAHSVTANATSKMNQVAGKINGGVSTAKAQFSRTVDPSRWGRFLKRSYCNVWGLIGSIYKKSEMPPSCSYNSK